ncbi:MAG: efflux RND transporter permease subunit [Deltaproteobacteria bacterium]|nr:efflux RND transporter permease subunit [Deltaproteobacteria bacterium]
MIERIIEGSIRNRFIVIIVTAIAAIAGIWAMLHTPVDAIPDLSDVQVIVYTDYPGQAPQVVEDQVTYPLTTAMLSVPHARTVRGYSFFGLSMVYVIFEDGTDLYWARSRVLEYLNFVRGRLPSGLAPQLGPDATGVGWVYMYSLTSDRHDLAQLRSIQDWYLRYELMSLPGVAEVASAGGFVKQYQVEVDPEKLRAFRLSLATVNHAIKRSNIDVGGRVLEMGETEFMVRGKGYVTSIEDLENIPVGVDEGTHTPIMLSQVANIQIGPEIRRGVIEMNGKGEAVAGIVVMRSGENALEVIEKVRERLAELEAGLPDGVQIHTAYDRSSLILRAIATLKDKLGEEMIVVALIIILFLLHLRSAFVALVTLPLGILASFVIMKLLGINANIMSLGGIAIAIGVMVDASVVMVENLHKHREREQGVSQLDMVIRSAREVGPALFFSLVIVTVSFIPVFTLEQQEGRLFSPLAFTKTFAMAASSVLAITVIPVLMYYLVRGRVMTEARNPLSRFFIRSYRPLIRVVLRFPKLTVISALVILAATWLPFSRLGSEFMPPLNEGDLLYMPTTPPGISITKAKELLQQTDKIIASHPQVAHVLGKVGRAETATDPAPLSMIETTIILDPEEEWPEGKTIEDIKTELDQMIQFPGLTNAWTMPIKTRIDMLATGIKTPVGIKLMGDDLAQLSETGTRIEAVLRDLDGTLSVYSERVVGGNFIDIRVRRRDAARFGLTVADVQDVISSAIGGMNVSWTVEGLERYPISVRYPRELRSDLDRLERVAVPTPMGHAVPLAQVADIEVVKGAPAIKSENARRTAWIFVDLETSDVGGYVRRAREVVSSQVELPEGVSIVWSGQYEYMERANRRLSVVVPLTLAIIFLLLYMHFRNATETLIVMLTIPFALVGGVWLMFFSGYHLSVAVAVGFIALAGLAAETGVVMLVYLDEAYVRRKKEGRIKRLMHLKEAIIEGAVERVRPKLMTVATTTLALLPIMFGTETGTRVMKRIAAPMVGGLISSTILTLLILPAIFLLWKQVVHRNDLEEERPEKAMQGESHV